jgi:hypothetical protein
MELSSRRSELNPGGPPGAAGNCRFGRADDWRRAQERMLLYLQTLQIPPERCLLLAHEAFERARSQPQPQEPVQAAMRSLFSILAEQGFLPDAIPDFSAGRWCRAANGTSSATLRHLPCGTPEAFRSAALPPIRRHPITAAAMDIRPWRGTLARCRKSLSLRSLDVFGAHANLLMNFVLLAVLWIAGV